MPWKGGEEACVWVSVGKGVEQSRPEPKPWLQACLSLASTGSER